VISQEAASVKIERNPTPKPKPPTEKLGFGLHFTDHMLRMDYEAGKGWDEPHIVPYGPLSLDPAAAVFHYAQTLFEGFKAYRGPAADPTPRLFRPQQHLERLNATATRMCMPAVDPAKMLEAVRELIRLEADWIPREPNTALYVRPVMFATEAFLGVRPAHRYVLLVILSPVGHYWSTGVAPVRIWVEEEHVRAARGGTGAAKTGGNYAGSLFASERAKARGYQQVLWLDEAHEQVEEVGTMNVFFVLGDKLVTPPLSGSLLAGVTRDSILKLARHWKLPVEERPVRIEELRTAAKESRLKEAFGTGTAALISPIGELAWRGEKIAPGEGQLGPVGKRLLDALTGITSGREPDTFEWLVRC
jgi:branched-chain amino acid aminotransferase